MTITIHRGTHEIGGSCVELSTKDSRIIIDIGMPLVDSHGDSFDMRPYRDWSIEALTAAGVLPAICGLYPGDGVHPGVDAVLVSHPHLDHYGLCSYIREDVPVYLGEAAKELISFSAKYSSKNGDISHARVFRNRKVFTCGGVKITPYLMDHSAFDAYAFLIEADGKRIVYSGDFRSHGRKPGALDAFLSELKCSSTIKNPAQTIDALIMEGTVMGRNASRHKTEAMLEDELFEIVRQEQITLVSASSTNIDRLVSLYKAVLRAGKTLAVDVYTAHVLKIVGNYAKIPCPSQGHKNLRVIFPYKIARQLGNCFGQEALNAFAPFKLSREEIENSLDSIVMLVKPSMVSYMEKIRGLEQANFVYSMWPGYWEKESMKKLRDFVELNSMQQHIIHTSGHADLETLQTMVQGLKPQKIIPIHTFEPGAFSVFGANVLSIQDGEVVDI